MEIIFLLLGILSAGVGVISLVSGRKTEQTGRRTSGNVIGYRSRLSGRNNRTTTYAPVIAFRDASRGRCIVEHPIAGSAIQYPVGQQVRLVLTPDEPLRARIESSSGKWVAAIFLVVGVVLIGVFFAIFTWNLFSILIGGGVIAALVAQARKKKIPIPSAGALGTMIRNASTAVVVPEAEYDRGSLMAPDAVDAILRRLPRQALATGVILLLIGAGAIAGSYFWAQKRYAFLSHAAKAQGEVVEMARSSGKTTTWAPIVEFSPRGAWTTVRFKHRVSSSHPSWRIGQTVSVLYDPANPSDAMIDSGSWNRATPLIPGAAGLLAILLGFSAIKSGLRGPIRLQPQVH